MMKKALSFSAIALTGITLLQQPVAALGTAREQHPFVVAPELAASYEKLGVSLEKAESIEAELAALIAEQRTTPVASTTKDTAFETEFATLMTETEAEITRQEQETQRKLSAGFFSNAKGTAAYEKALKDYRKKSATFFKLIKENNFGEFNAILGEFVKEDKNYMSRLVYSGNESNETSNPTIKLRVNFQRELNRVSAQLDPSKAAAIVESEKQIPTVLPSTIEMEKLILSEFYRGNGAALIQSLSEKTFKGYDPYLLRGLLVAARRACEVNDYAFPIALEQQIEELSRQEAFPLSKPKKLGGGKYNTVYLVTAYRDGQTVNKVWKPVAINNKDAKEGAMASSALSGIPRQATHANYIERSELTYRLDQLLFGRNGSICSKTERAFTMPDGISENYQESTGITSGVFMDLAPGTPVVAKKIVLNEQSEPGKYELLVQNFPKILDKYKTINAFLAACKSNKKDIIKLAPSLEINNSSGNITIINKEGGFVRKYLDGRIAGKALEGTIKLGFLDMFTGQTDRHYENYFIDENGNVMAIDNDLCLGSKAGARGQSSVIIPNNGSLLVNLPKIITRKIKNSLDLFFANQMDKEYLAEVAQTFPTNSEEYKKTEERIQQVKDSLKTVVVVSDSDTLLEVKNLSMFDSETNYLTRDLLVTKKGLGPINSQGWNPYRANRKAIPLSYEGILSQTTFR